MYTRENSQREAALASLQEQIKVNSVSGGNYMIKSMAGSDSTLRLPNVFNQS